MYIRRKVFSDNEKKISTMDKINLATGKLLPRKEAELQADYWDMDDEEKSKKAGKKIRKRWAVLGGVVGAGAGAKAATEVIGKSNKALAIGAAAGAGLVSGASVLSHKLGDATARKLYKNSEKYRNTAKKSVDQYKVGAKKMTREEYIDKYGK